MQIESRLVLFLSMREKMYSAVCGRDLLKKFTIPLEESFNDELL